MAESTGIGSDFVARRRVLVIDDERGVLRVMGLLLRNHQVLTFTSAEEALACLETDADFDAVLCDCRMPGMGGRNFWERLRHRHPRLRERVAFMTGGVADDDDESFLERTGLRVLSKPFDVATVRALVAELSAK